MTATILCRLSNPLLSTAQQVLRTHSIKVANSRMEILRIILRRPVTTILVDPNADEYVIEDVKWLRHRFPSIPMVMFLIPTNSAFEKAKPWLDAGIGRIVIYGKSDTDSRLANCITEQEYPYSTVLFRQIANRAPALGMEISAPLHTLFKEPSAFFSVQSLAIEAGVSRRQFDHCLRKSGLKSAHTLLTAAHLCRAYEYLINPGITATKAAELLGYSDLRVLNCQAKKIFGSPITQLRFSISPDDMMERLTQLCVASPIRKANYIIRDTTALISSTS